MHVKLNVNAFKIFLEHTLRRRGRVEVASLRI